MLSSLDRKRFSNDNGTPTNFGIGLRDHLAALAGTPTATNTPAPMTNTPVATNTPAPATATAIATATAAAPTATATTALPPTRAATASATASAGGNVTAMGNVTSGSGPWWGENDVLLTNTAPLTALRVTVIIQKTSGANFAGQYTNFPGGALTQSYTDTGHAIVYTCTVNAGQTVPAGNYVLDSQHGGNGTSHPTAGDTYSVTATAGGVTSTVTGHF